MRIAVITESFLPTVNGVTTSVCRILENFASRGDDAIVMAPDAGSPASYAGFPVREAPALAYRQFPVGLPTPAVQRTLDEFKPDVVHVASPFLLGAQGIQAARRLGIASVAIYQTDIAGFAKMNRMASAVGLTRRVVRAIHNAADLTLAPSSSAIAELERSGVHDVRLWGRGVDTQGFHPRLRGEQPTQELRARLAPHGETLVGYIGRLAPEKEVELLAGLRGMRGVRLVVVGDGPSMPRLRARLGEETAFLGRLGGAELARAYAALDVFVHPGRHETFGQTVQEAHASGLPVIAPRAGGPVDLVTPGTDGFLFEPGDAVQLRAAVATLASDTALRARMGEAGRRRVLRKTWAALTEELIAHYGAAMTSRRLPRAPYRWRAGSRSTVSAR